MGVLPLEAQVPELFDGQENLAIGRNSLAKADTDQTWEDWFDSWALRVNYLILIACLSSGSVEGGLQAIIKNLLEGKPNHDAVPGSPRGMKRPPSLTNLPAMAQETIGNAPIFMGKFIQSPFFKPTMGGVLVGAIVLATSSHYMYQQWDSHLDLSSNIKNMNGLFWTDPSSLSNSGIFVFQKIGGYSLGMVVEGLMVFAIGKSFRRYLENHRDFNIWGNNLERGGYIPIKGIIISAKFLFTLLAGSVVYSFYDPFLMIMKDLFCSCARLDWNRMQKVFFNQVPDLFQAIIMDQEKKWSNGWNGLKGWV